MLWKNPQNSHENTCDAPFFAEDAWSAASLKNSAITNVSLWFLHFFQKNCSIKTRRLLLKYHLCTFKTLDNIPKISLSLNSSSFAIFLWIFWYYKGPVCENVFAHFVHRPKVGNWKRSHWKSEGFLRKPKRVLLYDLQKKPPESFP